MLFGKVADLLGMSFLTKQKEKMGLGPDAMGSSEGGSGRPPGGGGSLVSASKLELSGQWGHVFGPLDLEIDRGGVTLIEARPGAARVALMLAIAGRMKMLRGHLTVLGETGQHTIFQQASLAGLDEVDQPKPSVTVRDLVTDQLRWEANFFKWVPQATEDQFDEMCGYLFEGLPQPDMDTFVADLPELEQQLIRIAVANTRRKPLLVVGPLDRMADRYQQEELLDRLVKLGGGQSVVSAHVNAGEYRDRVSEVVEVPELFEFQQRERPARRSAPELDVVIEADEDRDREDSPESGQDQEETPTEVINPKKEGEGS